MRENRSIGWTQSRGIWREDTEGAHPRVPLVHPLCTAKISGNTGLGGDFQGGGRGREKLFARQGRLGTRQYSFLPSGYT